MLLGEDASAATAWAASGVEAFKTCDNLFREDSAALRKCDDGRLGCLAELVELHVRALLVRT